MSNSRTTTRLILLRPWLAARLCVEKVSRNRSYFGGPTGVPIQSYKRSSQEVISPRWRKEGRWVKEKMMGNVGATGLVTGPLESLRIVARARREGALCVDGVGKESSAAEHVSTMDRSRMSKITPNIAESEMSVSTRKKYESLGAALSRVAEEARGIGKVQTTVEKVVVGAGGSLQEVGTRATAVGTTMEAIGPVEEALGELGGMMPRL